MFNRQEVLDFINGVIIDNQGKVSTEDTVVRESGIDSLGFAIIFLELDGEYGCFDNDFTNSIPDSITQVMTIRFLIDRVEECS